MSLIKKGNIETEMAIKANSVVTGLLAEKSDEDMRIETLIRREGGYSMSEELAIHRKKMMGTLPDKEWDAYCAYVEECIREARETEPASGND